MVDENTSIWACGESIDIGCRVIKWDEPGGYSFYNNKKFNKRNLDFAGLKAATNSFTFHYSVTYNSKQTYAGLIARNLSVNFVIDDDNVGGYSTVYQCLDLKDAGWSQTVCNNSGAGVEISYHPEYFQNVNLYSAANQTKYNVPAHETTTDDVHGQKLHVFIPTQAQINSCIALGYGICKLFDIPAEFPKDKDGNYIKTNIDRPEKFKGLLNHYSITRTKIDTVGLNLKTIEDGIKEKL